MTSLEQIRRLEEQLRQGDLSPEPDTSAVFDELLADDVLFVQPHGNSVGKAGVLKGHQPPRKRAFSRVDHSEVELREFGSTVVVSCRTDYATRDRAFAQRAVRIWNRVKGSWKVAVVVLMEVPGDEG